MINTEGTNPWKLRSLFKKIQLSTDGSVKKVSKNEVRALTLMRTKTSTGTKSSAPGTESSLARLRRFMMVEHMRSIHWTLSRGVLYALMVLISD